MIYRIWCEVSGGITGSRQAWLKKDGKIYETEHKIDAEWLASSLNKRKRVYLPTKFNYTVKCIGG